MKRTLKHISYSMGNFANTIAYQVFGNRIQFYYVDVLRLNAATAGVLWTIYGLWNAINDPLMGQVSDRTRSSSDKLKRKSGLSRIPVNFPSISERSAPTSTSIPRAT
jgi:Na+/melibiose symporter-like transporter